MRTTTILIFLFISTFGSGQNKSPGLFGNCDGPNWGYMCQQINFEDKGTFTFYDLLHLRGWNLSYGNWKRTGDTLILNTPRPFCSVDYKSTSTSDSIAIHLTDSIEPLPFATMVINSGIRTVPLSGIVKVERRTLDTIFVFYPSTTSGPIIFDPDKLKDVGDIYVNLFPSQFGTISFSNEKWLLDGSKLYHTKLAAGNFDRERYYQKATNLKYNKDK